MKIDKNKIFNYIVILLNCLLYTYIIAFYSFVIRARIKLGEWPIYNHPDPKLLHFDIHREFIIPWSFDLSILSIFLILLLFLISLIISVKIKKKYFFLYILGVLLIIYNIVLDPFMEWYAD